MRARIALSSSCSPFVPLVTNCESRRPSPIGTMNASTTTTMSCFGLLIGDECATFCCMVDPAPERVSWVGVFATKSCRPSRASRQRGNEQPQHYTAGGRSFDGRGRMPIRAPVAQLDRVLVSEAKGHRFDSCRERASLAKLGA